jgi:hypothetical protein
MRNIGWVRILLGFLAGFLVASNLNWGVAEFLLNPWATPRFDGFMRSAGDGGMGLNIIKMNAGWLLAQLVACALVMVLPSPAGWMGRGVAAGGLIGLAGFYGSYTFLSGWGKVNWMPLMGAATADTLCLIAGCLVFAYVVRGRFAPV